MSVLHNGGKQNSTVRMLLNHCFAMVQLTSCAVPVGSALSCLCGYYKGLRTSRHLLPPNLTHSLESCKVAAASTRHLLHVKPRPLHKPHPSNITSRPHPLDKPRPSNVQRQWHCTGISASPLRSRTCSSGLTRLQPLSCNLAEE